MTAARRGRPPVFDDEARAQYLEALAEGGSMVDAASAGGITARWASHLASVDAGFAEARRVAKRNGKRARSAGRPHGSEGRYVHEKCRCELCTKAAATARQARRDAAGDVTAGVGGVSLLVAARSQEVFLPAEAA